MVLNKLNLQTHEASTEDKQIRPDEPNEKPTQVLAEEIAHSIIGGNRGDPRLKWKDEYTVRVLMNEAISGSGRFASNRRSQLWELLDNLLGQDWIRTTDRASTFKRKSPLWEELGS